jgi:hypothetical protein
MERARTARHVAGTVELVITMLSLRLAGMWNYLAATMFSYMQ